MNPDETYALLAQKYGSRLLDPKRDIIIAKIKNDPQVQVCGIDEDCLGRIFNDIVYDSNLFESYIVPPFSVLNTKQGIWRSRKSQLDQYFGSSTSGRSEGLAYGDLKVRENDNGTSQFDSLLCEILLKWFGFSGCQVYDCFAGGHIRGSMAALLGYQYLGIELSPQQVEANYRAHAELKLPEVIWQNDDSLNADKYIQNGTADLVFSCPPYGDLEKYTDDPRDLSNMDYERFLETYAEIVKIAVRKLKNNRFAVFVVGDFRDSKGLYRGFVADTINIFKSGGANLYNEIILLNNIGTAPMRANTAFSSRKVVKLHQNVLVFFKGDPNTIKELYGKIDSRLPIPQANQPSLF